jgi:hypothetical protein
MPSSGILRRVIVVRTDVSDQRVASIIEVTRIGDLVTSLIIVFLQSVPRLVVTANVPRSPILVTVMTESICCSEGVTTRKTAFIRYVLWCGINYTELYARRQTFSQHSLSDIDSCNTSIDIVTFQRGLRDVDYETWITSVTGFIRYRLHPREITSTGNTLSLAVL